MGPARRPLMRTTGTSLLIPLWIRGPERVEQLLQAVGLVGIDIGGFDLHEVRDVGIALACDDNGRRHYAGTRRCCGQ